MGEGLSQQALGEVGEAEIASAAFSGVLTRMLASCADNGEHLTVRVREPEIPAQLEALASGTIDVGFLRWRPGCPADPTAVCLLEEEVVLALPEHHRLARLQAVPTAELRGERDIRRPALRRGTRLRDPVGQPAELGGFPPRLAVPVKDFIAALTLVGGDLGVALLPRSLRCVHMPGVVHPSVADAGLTTPLVGMRRRQETSPAVHRVIRLLHAAVADRAPS
ncbi:LysR family substrate-binding domain-containing protein [Streptomyces phyllanthi]|nr:LysR family substrate-binding domain-containing protein [Streptomyces phyllanthi]